MIKKRIICVDINCGDELLCIERLKSDIEAAKGGYVCFTNVHMLIEAFDDPEFCKVVNRADYAFPDGYPIAKAFRILHGIEQKRISGMDFLPTFLNHCSKLEYRVAFIGSTNEILYKAKKKIEKEFSGINLTALISPPFDKKWDNKEYINVLNQTRTQVVFVALGCPKQEKWMSENYSRTNALMFGIGGALPTFVEEVGRAPIWMQKNGLEWLYRLSMEPRRLFKRYWYTNLKFTYLLLRTKKEGH